MSSVTAYKPVLVFIAGDGAELSGHPPEGSRDSGVQLWEVS